VKDKEIAKGLEAILTEAFKVKQHGFTATELERQKKEILRNIEQAYRERDKTESRSYADEFIRNFLQDEAIPGVAVERDLSNYFVPNVTLAEINSLAAIRLNDGNRVVTVSSPKKDGFVPPTENEVLKILEEASTKKVDAYVDNIITKPLIEKKPKPGTVTKTKEIKEYSITEWTLSNGARVILKPTDFKNDEIVFSAYSRGGTSLASDKDFISAANAAATVSEGGVGEFDATTLRKLLAGKIVSVNPGISELSENFSGSASPEDLETLFQLVHLYFTSPRKDTAATQAYLARQKAFVENNTLSPESAFRDTFYVTTSQYHFRSRPMTVKILDEYNFDRAIAFYKDRYADASDFIFFFIGNFELVKMKPFVEQYLASLPNLKRKESWRDVNRISPKGVIEKEVRKGIDPKSYVLMSFTGSFEWNLQNLFDFQAMTEVLDIKLREVIREDKSGTYGVDVSGSPSFFPRKEYSITIWFGCAPERVKELTQAVLQQIDSIKLKQPEQIYMDKVKEMTRRELQVNRRENRWWLSTLRRFYANGEDLPPLSQVEKMIENLSGTAIQTAVSRYFNMNNYVRVVLFPEKKE
jgi:zinc protease